MRTVMALSVAVVLAAFCFGVAADKVEKQKVAKPAPKAEPAAEKVPRGPATGAPAASPTRPAISPDEDAIRKTGDTFTAAYDRGDAAAVAAHFTTSAEYVAETGQALYGRPAIGQQLAAFFKANPGRKIKTSIDAIRFVSPGVAMEDGSTTITHPDGVPPETSLYTAVHVKVDGQWLVASVRDHDLEQRPHSEQVQQLAWLVGDWIDEGPDSVVVFSCKPVDNGTFLLREFTVKMAGRDVMTGSQRIGWDPLTGRLRAWTFDSHGGHGEGIWRRAGESWILRSNGVTPDGKTASGTSIFTFVNPHTMTWQAVDHEVEGLRMPDTPIFKLVRKPPGPM